MNPGARAPGPWKFSGEADLLFVLGTLGFGCGGGISSQTWNPPGRAHEGVFFFSFIFSGIGDRLLTGGEILYSGKRRKEKGKGKKKGVLGNCFGVGGDV